MGTFVLVRHYALSHGDEQQDRQRIGFKTGNG